jgi:hypothetical protein
MDLNVLLLIRKMTQTHLDKSVEDSCDHNPVGNTYTEPVVAVAAAHHRMELKDTTGLETLPDVLPLPGQHLAACNSRIAEGRIVGDAEKTGQTVVTALLGGFGH